MVVVQVPLGRTRNTNAALIRFPASTRRPYLGPANRPIGPGKRPTRTVLSWRAMAALPDEAPRCLSSERPQNHQGRSSDVRENRWPTCPERGPVTRRRVVADSPLDFRPPQMQRAAAAARLPFFAGSGVPAAPGGHLLHADFDAPRLGRIAAASCHLGFSQLDAFLCNADVLQ